MDIRCCICKLNPGKKINIPEQKFYLRIKRGMTFYVCEQCIKDGVCPMCPESRQIYVGQQGLPGSSEGCSLCGGSGKLDYSFLNLSERIEEDDS